MVLGKGNEFQGNGSGARKQLKNYVLIVYGCWVMTEEGSRAEEILDIEFLHEIGSRMAAADPFHAVLERVVEFVSTVVMCDSCFVYVLEHDKLVLRASKNPHADLVDELDLQLGQGITGWVAMHQQPVAIASQASSDPRFKMFNDLPEDHFEAFLSVPILCRGKVVGVINVQHRKPHHHSRRQVRLISTVGFLVGAELEMARLESERLMLADRLEVRKLMDRAKGILQRELHLDEEGAYLALQKQSRQKRKAIREIAEAIILTEEIRRSRR
jgi:signal transduction protein with GAF and PtsI domain